MKLVAFVPIKLNSQRLPNKMFLPLGDKIICQHIFDTLLNVKNKINIPLDIYCFCSNEQIKQYLPDNIQFLKRDSSLDSNETKGINIYKSFVNKIDADLLYFMSCNKSIYKRR